MKKIYVLTVSNYFPSYHVKAGQPTGFVDAIYFGNKIHTIRANYELWRKRAEQINSGKAILSLRYWSGKPYRSRQVEFMRLEKIGLEMLTTVDRFLNINCRPIEKQTIIQLADNDGLSTSDFYIWFSKYDLTTPLAIIHFTDFRYANI